MKITIAMSVHTVSLALSNIGILRVAQTTIRAGIGAGFRTEGIGIPGTGIIGNTRLCSEEPLLDKIAVIPNDIGIAESFLRAFPVYQKNKPENGFRGSLCSSAYAL